MFFSKFKTAWSMDRPDLYRPTSVFVKHVMVALLQHLGILGAFLRRDLDARAYDRAASRRGSQSQWLLKRDDRATV